MNLRGHDMRPRKFFQYFRTFIRSRPLRVSPATSSNLNLPRPRTETIVPGSSFAEADRAVRPFSITRSASNRRWLSARERSNTAATTASNHSEAAFTVTGSGGRTASSGGVSAVATRT